MRCSLSHDKTLDPATRSAQGAFYTADDVILKTIQPLFLNALYRKAGEAPQEVLALLPELTFFDPACGSGNFLIKVIACLQDLERKLGGPPRVGMHQCYGIEIDPVAAELARAAGANVITGDALEMSWDAVLPREKCSYIIGNPPFICSNDTTQKQKTQVRSICGAGNVDFVSAWFVKSADYMQGAAVKAAFVATNSITQGTQVAPLWSQMFKRKIEIIHARRSFDWKEAGVHVVILCFCHEDHAPPSSQRRIVDGDAP